MISTLAGIAAIAFAQVATVGPAVGPSDGDSANRIRASIYETVRGNEAAAWLGRPMIDHNTRAEAPAVAHRPRKHR